MFPVGATYRLQLHAGFALSEARARVPYLHQLGVTHLYLSPILRSRSGSTHGYDQVDPTRLDPDLGDDSDLAELVGTLRAHEMGIVLDIVPNHMATGSENPFWEDVLTHGRASRFAHWFDIDWGRGPGRRQRVFLPVLGDRLGRALARGELQLTYAEERFRLRYGDESFPVDPATLPTILAFEAEGPAVGRPEETDPAFGELADVLSQLGSIPSRWSGEPDIGRERTARAALALSRLGDVVRRSNTVRAHLQRRLEGLNGPGGVARLRHFIEAQPYRLAYWRRAAREINYRRFFTLSHLVALRQEDPEVFRATHARVLSWVSDGVLDGLRIDHVDGLLDPLGYLEMLRGTVTEHLPEAEATAFPIYVEKILARDEQLRDGWPVEGTTGYDFLNQAEDLFIDPAGHTALTRIYETFVRHRTNFGEIAARAKRHVLRQELAADVRRQGQRWRRLCESDDDLPVGVDPRSARLAIEDLLTHLPVYRTYADERPPWVRPPDLRALERAAAGADDDGRSPEWVRAGLLRTLRLEGADRLDAGRRRARIHFVQRVQQLSTPTAAKGVEDMALYIYVPITSRNEVGGEPDAPLTDAGEKLHEANLHRALQWPRALLCTTTHDTKRSADVRGRLDVLSEMPDLWAARLTRWHRWHRARRRRVHGRHVPDRNTECLFYQTLLGVWPVRRRSDNAWDLETFAERMTTFMEKAIREAGVHTSWVAPDADYETAVLDFVGDLLTGEPAERFLSDITTFAAELDRAGLWNSAARSLIHLTAPGVPDLYQGDELPRYLLVDPDNRQPVDFDQRARLLGELTALKADGPEPQALADLVERPEDGRLKLWIVHSTLAARRVLPSVFRSADYRAAEIDGPLADHAFGFFRQAADTTILAVVPRLTRALVQGSRRAPVGTPVWRDTLLRVPPDLVDRDWRSALSGARISGGQAAVPIGEILETLPVALWVSEPEAGAEGDSD